MVCYYKGDSLQDSSAAANHLTAAGSWSGPYYETVTSTPFSSSPRDVFIFNGSGRATFYLQASVPTLPVADTPRTMMGWIRIDQTSQSWATPFAYGGGVISQAFHFSVTSSGGTVIDAWSSRETNNGLIEADHGPFAVWKHYAITWDGTNLIVYVNGVQTYTGTVNAPLQTALTEFTIGTRSVGVEVLHAAVAEVAVFNRALTQNEITIVYGTGKFVEKYEQEDFKIVSNHRIICFFSDTSPSASPSLLPSTNPSSAPSLIASTNPSSAPSVMPSVYPPDG